MPPSKVDFNLGNINSLVQLREVRKERTLDCSKLTMGYRMLKQQNSEYFSPTCSKQIVDI